MGFFYVAKNLVCCSAQVGDIVSRAVAGSVYVLRMLGKHLHDAVEVSIVVDLQSATALQQALGLGEMLVVGTEDDGNSPHAGFQRVVDADAETATHIGDGAIVVDAAEQSEAVDDEHVGVGYVLRRRLGVAHDLAFDLGDDLLEVVLADDVRRNDHLPLFVLIEVWDEDVLVGWP